VGAFASELLDIESVMLTVKRQNSGGKRASGYLTIHIYMAGGDQL